MTHEESSIISQRMCELIERKLKEATTPHERLAHLYLIDSLVKQLPQSPYAKLFSVGIASAFVASLAATDSDPARQRMFELRRAWIGVFPDSVMRELDLAVRAIDPGWPVLAEISSGTSMQSKAAGGRPGDLDMRRSWSQYRRTRQSWGGGSDGSGGGYVDLRQFDSHSGRPPSHPTVSLDQQQAAIEALLRRVQPESLGSEARRQLLGCVRDLQRLSAPGSSGRRLAESLAATLGCPDASAAEQIPEQVDSALDQLLSEFSQAAPSAPLSPALPPASAPLPTNLTSVTSIPKPSSGFAAMDAAAAATPNFSQIGCDPRLLAPIKDRFEASRDILVNGEIKRLALDRIQPLLVERGESRVVRFRFPPGAAVFLEWEGGPDPVRLRLAEYTKVQFGRRPFVVCLGGPGHELVIHGKPFNVPFNEPKLVQIRAGFFRCVYQVRLQAVLLPGGLPVTPALDVGPPIPGQWLQWANNGAFGAVSQLHKPPLNPLRSSGADSEGGRGGGAFFNSPAPFGSRLPPPPPPPSLPPVPVPGQQAAMSRSQPTDVLKMLNSLVKAGLIAGSNRDSKPTSSSAADVVTGNKRRADGDDATMAKRSRRTGATGSDDSDDEDLVEAETDDAAAAPSAIDYDSDVDLPVDLTDLVEEKLEQRLPAVAYRLVGGFQCPQCTLRFTRGPESASFQRHMDEHYRRRVWQRTNPPAKCRAWYPHWSQLVKPADDLSGAVLDYDVDGSGPGGGVGSSVAAVDAIASSSGAASESEATAGGDAAAAAVAVCRVPARSQPESNICGVCYEQFDTRWDDDTEDWLLQDCVELGGGIYHPVCAEDAGKATTDTGEDSASTAAAASAAGPSSISSTSAAAALLSILKEAVGLQ